jgi:hypothetical protein
VYLSTGRFTTGEESEEGVQRQAQYSDELDAAAALLKSGRKVDYDEEELRRLKRELEMLKSVPRAAPWTALFRLFLPGLLFLGAIWLLNFLIRALGHR